MPATPGRLLACLTLSLAAVCASHATAASAPPGHFDPLQTFAPFAYPQTANAYRSASGKPGPLFWQNRADYVIKATLDPTTRQLRGAETITYTNHSPDSLDVLWLQVEQNRYRRDARGAFGGGAFPTQFTDGEHIAEVGIVDASGHVTPTSFLVSDTRMQVTLPTPLPHDGTLKLYVRWSYTVPGPFGGRTDVNPSKNGDIFEIAQWYPRLCVYDDLRGWDTQPYLNSEFYLEYGDFDYSITVPSEMIVVGSGELLNPQDVLTATERARLEQARHSDATVMIRSPADVTNPADRPHGRQFTWHFRMHHTRDVVFGASKAYVWDAARINLPDGKTALAMSVYPVESAGRARWGRATEYLKAATEYFSRQWYPYPYPVAINEAGTAGGMEYPGLTFDDKDAGGSDLHALIAHEIGHTWFPMIVGSNERRDAWMDEGFNTFIDVYEDAAFNHGEYAPKRDGEYAPEKNVAPADQIAAILADPDAPPPLTYADQIREKYRHPITYFKSAFGLTLLREQILGPQRFDAAFRRYIATWAYKHPSPSDFFRFMASDAGEDLDWFWNGWYAHNWQFDMAIEDVQPAAGGWSHGARVTLANLDRLALPNTLRVVYANGSHVDVRIPVETWFQHTRYTVDVAGTQPVAYAQLDPDHALPDHDRANDRYTVGVTRARDDGTSAAAPAQR